MHRLSIASNVPSAEPRTCWQEPGEEPEIPAYGAMRWKPPSGKWEREHLRGGWRKSSSTHSITGLVPTQLREKTNQVGRQPAGGKWHCPVHWWGSRLGMLVGVSGGGRRTRGTTTIFFISWLWSLPRQGPKSYWITVKVSSGTLPRSIRKGYGQGPRGRQKKSQWQILRGFNRRARWHIMDHRTGCDWLRVPEGRRARGHRNAGIKGNGANVAVWLWSWVKVLDFKIFLEILIFITFRCVQWKQKKNAFRKVPLIFLFGLVRTWPVHEQCQTLQYLPINLKAHYLKTKV